MSLYNALFGVHPFACGLLDVLGLKMGDVPRFRDVFIENGQIVIYTRTGGGNRKDYEALQGKPSNESLRRVPGFVRDCDDSFDSTFAYFYYNVPQEYQGAVNSLAEAIPRAKPSELWANLLAKVD